MKKIAVLLCVTFAFAGAVMAQYESRSDWAARTVTNADLEPFQKQRIAAEKEYRATYAQKGQPSPEEIDRIKEQNAADLQDLSERLSQSNLERDRAAAELALGIYAVDRLAQAQAPPPQPQESTVTYGVGSGYYPNGYYPGWGSYYPNWGYNNRRNGRWDRRGRYGSRFFPGVYNGGYYVSGGSAWPSGTGTSPQPFPFIRGGWR